MAWLIQALEIMDGDEKGTGRYRLTATSDEDGGGPNALCKCPTGHATALEARECQVAAVTARRYGTGAGDLSVEAALKAEQVEAADADVSRFRVRCTGCGTKQNITVRPAMGAEKAKTYAMILMGSPEVYVHPPDEKSPIGKCSTCGAQVEVTVEG